MTETYTLSMPTGAYVSHAQNERELFAARREAEEQRAWKNINYFGDLAKLKMPLGVAAYSKYYGPLMDLIYSHDTYTQTQLDALRALNQRMESDYPPY
jgi:hypothetical protein